MREIVFVNIVQKLSATFGNPKYIDRYYGYIWSIVKLKRNCLTFSLSEKQLLSETTYRLIPIFYENLK